MRLRHLIMASTFIVAAAIPSIGFADTVVPNTNRPGSDYRGLDVGDSGTCRNTCLDESRCVAWTFVRPGIQGRSARCWLKDKVPTAVQDSCCTSGTRAQPLD